MVAKKAPRNTGVKLDPLAKASDPRFRIGPVVDGQAADLGPAAQSADTLLDTTKDAQFRDRQLSFADQLQQQVNGEGPSVANAQFKLAADRNIAQQSAIAASQRGAGSALAGRQAAINSAGIGQDLAAQSQIQRYKEQLDAQGLLGMTLNQGRTSDISIAGQNATLQNSNNQFNTGQTNTQTQVQGGLTTQANLANAAARNQAQISQAGINQADVANSRSSNATITAAGEAASGNVRAAGIGANASKYATDATNFRFTQGLQQQLDQNAFANQNYMNGNY